MVMIMMMMVVVVVLIHDSAAVDVHISHHNKFGCTSYSSFAGTGAVLVLRT